ncbi:HTH domain-containing protein [Natrinema salaciae]|uniref:Uncharacterized protein n=1 Tax=Natrinema salaciae TaxID=1186196 RepID=A0A1H9M4X3_9EURY|nr:HTH domain-containing protein [Natrinema salaciae]SER18611.1 hypothetical protein SAMN04489841_3203 [Natrinema salaciae]
MPVREPAAPLIVDPDSRGAVRVDCYVRSNVPAAVSEQLSALVERLRTIREREYVDELRINRWPAQHSVAEESGPTCTELVAEFERWADRNGYSLEPGFRRRSVPPSPLGVDGEPRERVRVPLVALALYEDADDADADILRGVVPCTELSYTGDERTCTVDEWLTAVETRALDEPVRASQIDQTALLEGQ